MRLAREDDPRPLRLITAESSFREAVARASVLRGVAPVEAIEDALARVAQTAPRPLRAVVADALAPPAKRMRPRLVLLAFEAAGGARIADVLDAAVAIELVHASSLLVDDVVDEARVRRGRPAAHVRHGPRAALLAAGWLLNDAQRRIARDGEDEELWRVTREAVASVLEAEALAMERGDAVAFEDWLEIARGKTGALFLAAADAGSRCAGGDDATTRALRRFGMSLGVAFQAADDLLDVAGDLARTGKDARDLAEGAPNLARAVGVDEARSVAARFALDAVDALSTLPASGAREALVALARSAAARDH